jgi:hypothetical protein
MNDLIIFQDNKPIISSEFKENYKKFVNLKSQIEEAQAVIKKELINYYESLPEDERKTIDFDSFKVSYVKPSTRKTFDSKKLQDEDIDTYNKYLKTTEVSSTIKYI